MDGKQQRARWVEHLEELLNRPAPPYAPDIHTATQDLPIDCRRTCKVELRQLQNGKVAGPSNIPFGRLYSGDALPSLQEDLRRGMSAIRLEGGLPHQDAKERQPQQCCHLQRLHTPVHSRKSIQHNPPEPNERASWCPTKRPTSWLSQGQILHRPNCYSTNHHWAVGRIELLPLHQLHRLWKGIWQCESEDTLETSPPLWSTSQDGQHHPELIQRNKLQSSVWRAGHECLQSEDRSSSRLSTLPFTLPSGNWLNYEAIHRPRRESSGHPSHSFMTWILPMIYYYCPIPVSRCRTKPTEWLPPQHK